MLSQINRKDEFKSYLEKTCHLSARTVKAYVDVVQTVAEQMLPTIDLFGNAQVDVVMSAIEQWKDSVDFKQMDSHGRFSAPLKHYVSFFRQLNFRRQGFRLICVYVEKYAAFKKQCFNFCSDYRVRLMSDSREEIKFEVNYNPLLPVDFFSVVTHKGGCVSSVSAFIGENAAGKTSFARLFHAIACGYMDARSQPKVVVIFEIDGILNVLTTYEEPKILSFIGGSTWCDMKAFHSRLDSIRIYRQTKSGGSLPFKFFYYSPFYTTGQSVGNEGDSVVDISATQLLHRPPGNLELLVSRDHVQASSIFEAEETRRILEFVSEYRRRRSKNTASQKLMNFDMPCPRWVEINLYDDQVRHAIKELTDYVDNVREQKSRPQTKVYATLRSTPDELRDEVGDFLRRLVPVFKNKHDIGKTSLIVHWFIGYSACYLSECGILNPSFALSKMGDWYGQRLRDFLCRELTDENGNDESKEMKIIEFLRANVKMIDAKLDTSTDDNVRIREALIVFEELRKLLRMRVTRRTIDGLICSFRSLYCLRMLIKLIQSHAKSKVFSPYLRFSLVPSMSSGELAFLAMFARFYEFVLAKTKPGENVIVFLDEAETTLHPAWQRRLVDNLIRFFEVFIPDRRYQLMFASHSPILLSDLPSGNCTFIEKHEKDRTLSVVRSNVLDKAEGFTNTFAANIQDLYAVPFFLNKKSTIGQFATDKIRSDQNTDMLRLIGNPILRAVLKGTTQEGKL